MGIQSQPNSTFLSQQLNQGKRKTNVADIAVFRGEGVKTFETIDARIHNHIEQ